MPPAMAHPTELRGDHDPSPADGCHTQSLSSLPDDLTGKVLALLPLQAKLACRCVCRSWNSILSTDAFLTHTSNANAASSSSSAARRAHFMLATRGRFAYALDPAMDLWQKLRKPECPGASVLAASHSLVCVGNQVSECRSLIIFDLLSGAWRLLPDMLCVGLLHKVTLAVEPMSQSYVVVVIGEDTADFRGRRTCRLRTEVYDSVASEWRMAGDAIPEATFGSGPGVWDNGVFYCITEMPYGITAFELAKGQWMVPSVKMPIRLSHPTLASCQGQVMMVGIQDGDSEHVMWNSDSKADCLAHWQAPADCLPGVAWQVSRSSSWPHILHVSSPVLPEADSASLPNKSVKIWSWKSGKQWLLTDEMPEEFSSKLMAYLTPNTPLICAGVGNDICISSHQNHKTVIFDARNLGWRLAASDPLFPHNRDAHLLGFAVHLDNSCLP